jgi:polyhydroxyalkanoate synthesis regulator phasin
MLDPVRLIQMGIGLADYMRENFDSLSDEFVERGRNRTEDVRDYIADIAETLPFNRHNSDMGNFEQQKHGFNFLDMFSEFDGEAILSDLMAFLGIQNKHNESQTH